VTTAALQGKGQGQSGCNNGDGNGDGDGDGNNNKEYVGTLGEASRTEIAPTAFITFDVDALSVLVRDFSQIADGNSLFKRNGEFVGVWFVGVWFVGSVFVGVCCCCLIISECMPSSCSGISFVWPFEKIASWFPIRGVKGYLPTSQRVSIFPLPAVEKGSREAAVGYLSSLCQGLKKRELDVSTFFPPSLQSTTPAHSYLFPSASNS